MEGDSLQGAGGVLIPLSLDFLQSLIPSCCANTTFLYMSFRLFKKTTTTVTTQPSPFISPIFRTPFHHHHNVMPRNARLLPNISHPHSSHPISPSPGPKPHRAPASSTPSPSTPAVVPTMRWKIRHRRPGLLWLSCCFVFFRKRVDPISLVDVRLRSAPLSFLRRIISTRTNKRGNFLFAH